MKKGIKIGGHFSFLWLLVLAAILYTGVCLIKKAARDSRAAVDVFTTEEVIKPVNNGFIDLLR